VKIVKKYIITHKSGSYCELEAKGARELRKKLSTGHYGIMPIRGNRITLVPGNISKIEEIKEIE
jgi:hypothetical protein